MTASLATEISTIVVGDRVTWTPEGARKSRAGRVQGFSENGKVAYVEHRVTQRGGRSLKKVSWVTLTNATKVAW